MDEKRTCPDRKIPPPGRGAVRWFLFLSFFHLLPVPWYMAVVAGLAPASFLFAGGMASLFISDNDSLAFALFLLVPALVGGLIFYLAAWLLALAIGRMRRPALRTVTLAALLAACLIAAMNPIFVSGGHGSTHAFSLFDFIKVLGEFRIPASASIAYFSALAILLLGLLGYQQRVARHEAISAQRWQRRRRIRRRVIAGALVALVVFFCWTHRILLVVKPLADLGIASAQYRLAMAIKEQAGTRTSFGYQHYLVRAAEQGHMKAAQQLVLHPRSKEEKLRWLTVAAEGDMAEAQYQLYLELLKSEPGVKSPATARDWLEKAANNQQMDAQYEIGRHYINGHARLGIEKDAAAARQWLERAAGNGDGRAMKELSWRYEKGADGFPRDAQRAIELLKLTAEGYQHGKSGLPQNPQRAADLRAKAEQIATFEKRLAQGDPQAQAALGRELLQAPGASPDTIAEALALLEKAASQGDPQLQYVLGGIFLFGRHGVQVDLPRGRNWWAKALEQNHVGTMESVAPAYQNGRFGYPVDLLKSKALVGRLVEAYRDGLYGVDPDPVKERSWSNELKYFDRLFEYAGGSYQSPDELQHKAEAGDLQAQYQLGRQLMVSGSAEHRQQALAWVERAAEGGFAEAQYRLVTYFERQAGIMRNEPARGVAILQAAAEQNHLPAMGTLALGCEKGRYGLTRDLSKAKQWYERLLQAYEAGSYLGEIDERFIPFQLQRLIYTTKALETEIEKARRYQEASPLERQIIEIEERYRIEYQNAVNALDRRDGSPTGQARTRAEIERLRQKFHRLRDEEIARVNAGRS